MSSLEEEFRKLYSESRALEEYIQALRSRYQLLEASESTLVTAKDAISALSKSQENQQILVDVGGGVYIRCSIVDNKRALISIGEGVFIDKTVEECEKILEDRVESIRKAKRETLEELSKAQQQLNERQTRLSQISQKLSATLSK